MAHCVVIGAGISGACTAAALARRGWEVTVLDAAMLPASGASGLPVGLYAPYTSADNNLASQITAIGVMFTQKLASTILVEGIDWQPSGVMTCKPSEPEQWHANAGWVKPLALVKACLSQARVSWSGDCDVKSLVWDGTFWQLLGKYGQALIQTNMVVVAASSQSLDLLNSIPIKNQLNLQAIRGQVTFGDLDEHLPVLAPDQTPTYPINGQGSYIETNKEWLVGATFDRYSLSLAATIDDQSSNLERLARLAPAAARRLKANFEQGRVKNWVGIRCASHDRLPIVGEVAKGLWICTAMASRGLTFAPLCAELLAAQCEEDILPLHPKLVKALSVQRYMKK